MPISNPFIHCILTRYPRVQALYLFGSWGTSDQTHSSDLDIAVLLPPKQDKKIDKLEWLTLSQEIAKQADLEHVDLINLRSVDTVFQYQVVTTGRCVYIDDERAVDEFEITVVSLYQDLNLERADILKDGIESGRFYGI